VFDPETLLSLIIDKIKEFNQLSGALAASDPSVKAITSETEAEEGPSQKVSE
jgi:hypothetical protein